MPQQFDPIPFEIDHVIAEKHLGLTRPSNLALACFHCNNFKGPNIGGIDPLTKKLVPLFDPRHDAWEKHFLWGGAVLRAKTPLGRATIQVLAINLPHRIAHRVSLIDEGVFP